MSTLPVCTWEAHGLRIWRGAREGRINPHEVKENIHTVSRQENITFPSLAIFTHTGRNQFGLREETIKNSEIFPITSWSPNVCQCHTLAS
jgi:hypothetical protein